MDLRGKLRHRQIMLKKYVLYNLYLLSFVVGFPPLRGVLKGLVVWASCRIGIFDWLLNLNPAVVMFDTLTNCRPLQTRDTRGRRCEDLESVSNWQLGDTKSLEPFIKNTHKKS
uniref:Uncharacterized protein n=1 Tax=Chromera velia CCMP2878 TaxID=1169474 RepID=A0A0G4I4A3_9ALVE|eukprot:Cvel_35654.t1-p1 / transcript=Cvel_35654.t1 / gene=Cvel_35654 / organism=Chromera_velia_CCMP2878 / gene_product=hypothetical protein / transcript_product=hypothetical protein / location=Cvel_scaffold6612:732-1865(-) / protein_length=112 / sequence_SO=supercontig / SO=protein_coding / is_pseudo=false